MTCPKEVIAYAIKVCIAYHGFNDLKTIFFSVVLYCLHISGYSLSESYPINTNMTGFRQLSKNLCILVLWTKVALELEGLRSEEGLAR